MQSSRIKYIEVESEVREPEKETKKEISVIYLRKYVVIPEKDRQARTYYRSTAANSQMHQWLPCVFIFGIRNIFDCKDLPEEYEKDKIQKVYEKYGRIGVILKYGAVIKLDLVNPIVKKSKDTAKYRLPTKQTVITSSQLSLSKAKHETTGYTHQELKEFGLTAEEIDEAKIPLEIEDKLSKKFYLPDIVTVTSKNKPNIDFLRLAYVNVKIDEINQWFVDQKASVSRFIMQNFSFNPRDYEKCHLIWEDVSKKNKTLDIDRLQVMQAKAILEKYSTSWSVKFSWGSTSTCANEVNKVIKTEYINLKDLLKALNNEINKTTHLPTLQGDLMKSVQFIIKKSQVDLEPDYREEFKASMSSNLMPQK